MSNSKVVKAGVGYTIGNILIRGLAFLTLPVFSRILSTTDFGIYNTYVAYEAIISIISGMGMYSSIKNAKYDFPNQVNEYVSTLLIIDLGVTLLLSVGTVCFGGLISDLTGMRQVILQLLIYHSLGTALLSVVNARLSLDYDYKSYLIYAGFSAVFSVVMSILLIYTIYTKNRADGRIIGSAVPFIITGLIIFVREGKRGHFRFNAKMAKYALAFGVPLIWHFLAQQIASQFDRIMITSMVNASATGIYSFVYSIANILPIVFYSMDNVWGVWSFARMEENEYSTIRERSIAYMAVVTVITALMILFSKEVIVILGARAYWEGANLFVPIIIGNYLLFLYTIPVGVEYFFKETKFIAATTFLSAAVNIVLNYFCIKQFGYFAAAYTTAVSYLVMFLCHWVISAYVLKKHNEKVFYRMKDFVLQFLIVLSIGIYTIMLNDHPWYKYSIMFGLMLVLLLIFRNKISKILTFAQEFVKTKKRG